MKKVLAVTVLSMAAVPLLAHHGRGAAYDASKEITVEGTVSKVDWRNPHVHWMIDVKGPDGKVVTWAIEGNGTTNLSQQGYSRTTIKVGQQVRTLAVPARNGTPSALMRRIEDAVTGKELVRSGNDPFSDN
jgi:hypothetical protein